MEAKKVTETTTAETPTKSSSSSPFDSFKSKKILRSTSKSTSSDEIQPFLPNTPKPPMQLRSRSRGIAFTINQVKKEAQKINKSPQKQRSDPLDLIESSTPSKSVKKVKDIIKLPERYEVMTKFYDYMQTTIRLLKSKGTMRSFTNISPGVETLSGRRFTYTHLAQLKYILPEAIELSKVTLVDERTRCTRSDIEVSLLTDAIKAEGKGKGKAGSGYCYLSKVFHKRVREFVQTHSEGDEIPMGVLPEPFNSRIHNVDWSLKQNDIPSLHVHSSSNVLPQQNSVAASHLSRSFKTRFAQKAPISESEKTLLLSTTLNPLPQFKEADTRAEASSDVVPLPRFSRLQVIRNTSLSGVAPVSGTPPRPLEIDDKEPQILDNKACTSKEILQPDGTPAKLISTPARLMTTTPAMQTPKSRHIIQDDASTPSPNKLLRRPSRRLFQTPVKNRQSEDDIIATESSSSNTYLMKLLPEAVRHSIMEKENKANKEQEIAISQAKLRRQMIACLPKLFNMIHLMFQSVKGCVITKEELMHKIITNHLDITDKAELEEQLKLLKELVPDWIREIVASSGDVLLRIDKGLSADLIRRRLTEAL